MGEVEYNKFDKQIYDSYITSHLTDIVFNLISEDSVEGLTYITKTKKINSKNIDDFIEKAEEVKAINSLSFLTEYKNNFISIDDINKQKERNLNKELTKKVSSITEMKKIWIIRDNGDKTLSISGYRGQEKRLEIPGEIAGRKVTAISDMAFSFRKKESYQSLQCVTILQGITKVGNGVFEGCSNLQTVIIPDSVISILDHAFFLCENLTNVNIPGKVTRISKDMFACCKSLTSIDIPDSVTEIDNGAFRSCDSLTSINIPNGVKRIGSMAFNGCRNLRTINIPESVIEIGSNAFDTCSSLISINIPCSVKKIEFRAFCNCTSLKIIKIPDSDIKIDDSAFAYCRNVTISGKAGSSAEGFAIRDNIPFFIE